MFIQLFIEPPSAPKDLREGQVSHNRIELRWSPPMYDGGRRDLSYRVECQQCDSSVTFTPENRHKFNTTR